MRMSEIFEAECPDWREQLHADYRDAADKSFDAFDDGRVFTAADLGDLRHTTSMSLLLALGPLQKQMGVRLVEEACAIACNAYIGRLLELKRQPILSMKN